MELFDDVPDGEVVALDERRAQPAARGVERDADAGDAAADDEHVESLGGQSTDHLVAPEGQGCERIGSHSSHTTSHGHRMSRPALIGG